MKWEAKWEGTYDSGHFVKDGDPEVRVGTCVGYLTEAGNFWAVVVWESQLLTLYMSDLRVVGITQ